MTHTDDSYYTYTMDSISNSIEPFGIIQINSKIFKSKIFIPRHTKNFKPISGNGVFVKITSIAY